MRNTIRTRIVVAVILVCVLGIVVSTIAEADEPLPTRLTFVYTRPKDHSVTQWLILIYTEALKRMGIEFVLEEVPPKRASAYSDAGIVDAELGRIYNYNEKHPNLLRVEEFHAYVIFTAFVSDPQLKLDGWESLKDTNYKVEYRRGIKKCETQLPRVVKPEQLSDIATVHQGIQKLLLGRTDVYIDVEDFVIKHLNSDDFQQISKVRKVHKAGVMEQTSGHAFLHKKHHALVPKLSVILRDMKREGLFEKYRKQVGLTPIDITW